MTDSKDTDLKNNQENQNWGGKRPGAGRPKGSSHKPKIADDLSDDQKEALLLKAYQKAMGGSEKLLQFFLDQVYGKARQNIGLDGGEDDKPIAILTNALRIHNSNGEDSESEEEN